MELSDLQPQRKQMKTLTKETLWFNDWATCRVISQAGFLMELSGRPIIANGIWDWQHGSRRVAVGVGYDTTDWQQSLKGHPERDPLALIGATVISPGRGEYAINSFHGGSYFTDADSAYFMPKSWIILVEAGWRIKGEEASDGNEQAYPVTQTVPPKLTRESVDWRDGEVCAAVDTSGEAFAYQKVPFINYDETAWTIGGEYVRGIPGAWDASDWQQSKIMRWDCMECRDAGCEKCKPEDNTIKRVSLIGEAYDPTVMPEIIANFRTAETDAATRKYHAETDSIMNRLSERFHKLEALNLILLQRLPELRQILLDEMPDRLPGGGKSCYKRDAMQMLEEIKGYMLPEVK